MEKLYYERPYVKEFEATVLSCRQGKEGSYEVLLDRTGFYPEGGGQPSDTGSLKDAAVSDVRERAGEIVHITDRPLRPGSRVKGVIDWEKRFILMQNHSGEHILSGIIHRRYGLDNVGFHMGKEEVTIDFNGVLTREQIAAAETEANELIYKNLPVKEDFPSKEELKALDYRSKKELTGKVRIIEIPGGDVCACCGTHVMHTGEIGLIKVTGMIHYKGGVRLYMLCGKPALADYGKRQKSIAQISGLLSVKPDKAYEAVEKLKAENAQKDGKIVQLYRELLKGRCEAYPEKNSPLAVFSNDLAPIWVRQYCTMLYEEKKGNVVLVCSGDGNTYQYALGSSVEDMRRLSKSLNTRLNGRGGGSVLLAQGSFQASEEEIRRAFEEIEIG